jgi:hypothetical protein
MSRLHDLKAVYIFFFIVYLMGYYAIIWQYTQSNYYIDHKKYCGYVYTIYIEYFNIFIWCITQYYAISFEYTANLLYCLYSNIKA